MQYVYAMVTTPIAGAHFVKFGVAKNPLRRLSAIQVGCPLKIAQAYAVPCGPPATALVVESSLHVEFHGNAASGEWFKFPEGDGVREAIEALSLIAQRELPPGLVEKAELMKIDLGSESVIRRRVGRSGKSAAASGVVVGDAKLPPVRIIPKRRHLTAA